MAEQGFGDFLHRFDARAHDLLAPIIEEFGGPSRQALSYWARRPLVDRFGNVVGFAAALLSSVIAVAGAGTSGKTPIGF